MRSAWTVSFPSKTKSRCENHKPMLRFRPRVLWVAISGVFLFVGSRAVSQAAFFSSELTDFTVYLSAANALTRGIDPYSIESAHGWHFISPVATAVLFAPLTEFPTVVAAAIWYLLSVGFLAGTILLTLSLFIQDRDSGILARTWVVPLLLLRS